MSTDTLTPNQQNFIQSLFSEAQDSAEKSSHAAEMAESMLAPVADDIAKALGGTLDKRAASPVIDTLKAVNRALRNAVPVEGFRWMRPEQDENGREIFPVKGPRDHDGERVEVTSSKGRVTETILTFLRNDGPNAVYTALSPREMKALDAAQQDSAEAQLRERIVALQERVQAPQNLCVAWESSGHNDLAFWQLTSHGSVLQVIGGEHRRERASLEQAEGIVSRLEEMSDADILAAAALFGQELQHCGRCGRELTDETSRLVGIGPKCREKGGF